MSYQLSDTLVKAVVNYLKKKPFDEVSGLISAIIKEIEPQEKKAVEDKKDASA